MAGVAFPDALMSAASPSKGERPMSLKLVLSITILLVGFELPIEAHDIYAPLKDQWGNSCCNNEDCRPAPYRVTPTGVQMLLGDEWIAVPDHMIQYRALPGDMGETAGGIGAGSSDSCSAVGRDT
jgi:hypothetical protein